MSNSQSMDLWTDPTIIVTEKSAKPTVFNRLGNKLGKAFLFAKHKATDKYLEVTQGINRSIEEEAEMHRLELQSLLDEQAVFYEGEIRQRKKRWIIISIVLCILAFIAGATSVLFALNQIQ